MFYVLIKEVTDIISGREVITWHNETYYERKERAEWKFDYVLMFYKLGYWEVEEEETWRVVLHDRIERNKKLTLTIVESDFS